MKFAQNWEYCLRFLGTLKVQTQYDLWNTNKYKKPKKRIFTYVRIVVDYRKQKKDPNRVCITVGGNLKDHPFELTKITAYLITTQIMWNIVFSTLDTKYMCVDIKKMYLATPLERFEYTEMPIKLIPEESQKTYNLLPL